MPARVAQGRSTTPIPSGSAPVFVQPQSKSVSPRPSGPVRVYHRMEGSNVRSLHALVNKEDRTHTQKKERKLAKKRKAKLFNVDKAAKETIGRNVCQASGVRLSQMSDYERGAVTNSSGKYFKSPEALNLYEAMESDDSDTD